MNAQVLIVEIVKVTVGSGSDTELIVKKLPLMSFQNTNIHCKMKFTCAFKPII